MKNIASKFCVDGEIVSIKSFGNGHINTTNLIQTTKTQYILQYINKNVFTSPEKLMSNIQKVTSFLNEQQDNQLETLNFINSVENKNFYKDDNGDYWRMYEFVKDSLCLEQPESPDDFYECGFGFGNFQKQLNNFPAEQLFEIIPDFHNTPKRFETLLGAIKNDVCGRVKTVKEEIDFALLHKDFYNTLYDKANQGLLPTRVTHNDTKTNNVLLSETTRKAKCVIDLDTIMPGFSVNDFGDAIRAGANTACEDETDLTKVSLDLELFEAFTKGFLNGCDGSLTEQEIMLLPVGAKMMTIECGIRFLTDYLQGDTYFKTNHPTHNLDRCRTQFALVRDMDKKWQQMNEIVKKYV